MLRRKALWLAVFGAGLAIVAAFWLVARQRDSRLPPTARSDTLPPQFNRALKDARRQVVRANFAPDSLRALARLYQANRLDDDARACFAMIQAGSPGLNAHDHYYLADIAQNVGMLEEAATQLRAVVAEAPDYLPARLGLGNVLLKSGNFEEAERAYEGVLSIAAGQPQAMFGLARMDLRRGDDGAAVARLDKLMSEHPEMTSAAGLYAQVLDRLGRRERVPELTARSRQRPEPELADPWLDALLVDCYDEQNLGLKFEEFFTRGEVDRALPLLARFEQLDPASPIPHVLKGVSFSRVKDETDAVKEFMQALQMGADPEKVCPHIAHSLLALGRAPEAVRILAEYHAKRPDSIEILTAYSDVVLAAGDTKLAQTLLEDLLAKEPHLFAQNMSLAMILWTAGDRDHAAECLRRAADVSVKDVVSRSFLAEYFLGKGDPYSAIGPLEQAVAQAKAQNVADPKLGTMLYAAYMLAGDSESARGQGERAVSQFYDRAIRLAPDNAAGYAGKAKACAKLGQLGEAEAALETLRTLQPRNPTVYLSLGDVLLEDGKREEARHNWQQAYDLAPDRSTELRAALSSRLAAPAPEAALR
jgi:tetratricopeptide (TPR) repeat protein